MRKFRVRGKIWIEGPEGTFFGYGRFVLLQRIREHGSISAAARSMGMSYKRAWELVNSMNRQARKPLVETSVGGPGGGGARVASEGERMIRIFERLLSDHEDFLSMQSRNIASEG